MISGQRCRSAALSDSVAQLAVERLRASASARNLSGSSHAAARLRSVASSEGGSLGCR